MLERAKVTLEVMLLVMDCGGRLMVVQRGKIFLVVDQILKKYLLALIILSRLVHQKIKIQFYLDNLLLDQIYPKHPYRDYQPI